MGYGGLSGLGQCGPAEKAAEFRKRAEAAHVNAETLAAKAREAMAAGNRTSAIALSNDAQNAAREAYQLQAYAQQYDGIMRQDTTTSPHVEQPAVTTPFAPLYPDMFRPRKRLVEYRLPVESPRSWAGGDKNPVYPTIRDIDRERFTPPPSPESVIRRVEEIKQEKQVEKDVDRVVAIADLNRRYDELNAELLKTPAGGSPEVRAIQVKMRDIASEIRRLNRGGTPDLFGPGGFRENLPPGVGIWGGKGIDSDEINSMNADDAKASAIWYDLYLRTPADRGGATEAEKPDIRRWISRIDVRRATLRGQGATESVFWSVLGGFADSIASNPLTYMASAPFAVTIFWAKTFAEAPQTVDGMQNRATLRTKLLIDGGYNPRVSGFLAFIMAIGDLLPANKFVEAVVGVSTGTGRELSKTERAIAGAEAVVETLLWASGSSTAPGMSSFCLYKLPLRPPVTNVIAERVATGPTGRPVSQPRPADMTTTEVGAVKAITTGPGAPQIASPLAPVKKPPTLLEAGDAVTPAQAEAALVEAGIPLDQGYQYFRFLPSTRQWIVTKPVARSVPPPPVSPSEEARILDLLRLTTGERGPSLIHGLNGGFRRRWLRHA